MCELGNAAEMLEKAKLQREKIITSKSGKNKQKKHVGGSELS